MPPVISDEELVRRFQETGSSDCFAELFARHRRKVFSACRGFFADGAAAEDATQETFLRAYQRNRSFQGGNFAGWLMRIAKNVCIDQWRRRRAQEGMEEPQVTGIPAAGALESCAELHLAVEKIRKEIAFLSPEQRRCLEMKIEGYSYEETAASTGLSREAVKSHLQNGRRMLWLKMEGMGSRRR
ncbi:MAG: sigma-70 family RNA polymerase sigma factor [Terriglobia bacterium]